MSRGHQTNSMKAKVSLPRFATWSPPKPFLWWELEADTAEDCFVSVFNTGPLPWPNSLIWESAKKVFFPQSTINIGVGWTKLYICRITAVGQDNLIACSLLASCPIYHPNAKLPQTTPYSLLTVPHSTQSFSSSVTLRVSSTLWIPQ